MAQYAILIYAEDSDHAPDAAPEDTRSSDRHSDELAKSGSMVMAYALDAERYWRRRSGATSLLTARSWTPRR